MYVVNFHFLIKKVKTCQLIKDQLVEPYVMNRLIPIAQKKRCRAVNDQSYLRGEGAVNGQSYTRGKP